MASSWEQSTNMRFQVHVTTVQKVTVNMSHVQDVMIQKLQLLVMEVHGKQKSLGQLQMLMAI